MKLVFLITYYKKFLISIIFQKTRNTSVLQYVYKCLHSVLKPGANMIFLRPMSMKAHIEKAIENLTISTFAHLAMQALVIQVGDG